MNEIKVKYFINEIKNYQLFKNGIIIYSACVENMLFRSPMLFVLIKQIIISAL